MIPNPNKPIQDLLAMVQSRTQEAQGQQQDVAEVYAQAVRYQKQEEERKKQEAIKAAIATLQQTEQATPDVQSTLAGTPYAGMIGPGGRLNISPQEQAERAQKAQYAKAQADQAKAYLELTRQRGAAAEQAANAPQEMSGIIGQTDDPVQALRQGMQSGALNPVQALRLWLQNNQAGARLDFQKSKPMPGAASAARHMSEESSLREYNNQLVELPDMVDKFGDVSLVVKNLVARRDQLGMNEKHFGMLLEKIRRGEY